MGHDLGFDPRDEDLVTFIEDGRTRSLRGVIASEDSNFVVIERLDGTWKIAASAVVKIVRRRRR